MNLAFDGQNLRGCMGTQSLLSGKACCEVTKTSPKRVCHRVSRILLGAAVVALGAILKSSVSLSLVPTSLFICHAFLCLSTSSLTLLLSPCSSFLNCYLYSSLSSFAHNPLRGPSCPESTSHPL